jgi:hypothetical protein
MNTRKFIHSHPGLIAALLMLLIVGVPLYFWIRFSYPIANALGEGLVAYNQAQQPTHPGDPIAEEHVGNAGQTLFMYRHHKVGISTGSDESVFVDGYGLPLDGKVHSYAELKSYAEKMIDVAEEAK